MSSQIKVNTINDASGGNNAVLYGPACPDNSMGFRNRLINGSMTIDQRNNGASVTVGNGTVNVFSVDRWRGSDTTDGYFTSQQVSDAPSGHVNSLKVTVASADASLGTTQFAMLRQVIEGHNVADFGFGTANAQTVTLSFWVKSSVTGTFSGVLLNGAEDRCYVFTYAISSANTWEQKAITIAGDTSGTWLTTNGAGLHVNFSFGAGTDYLKSAGSWGAFALGATGQTSLIATTNATWQITGVQLEAGSVATPFERRPYGMELALCQRYYEFDSIGRTSTFNGNVTSGSTYYSSVCFKAEKRASPTVVLNNATANSFPTTVGNTLVSIHGFQESRIASATASGAFFRSSYTANSEL